MGYIQSPRITKSATVSSAGGLSNAIDTEGYRIAALDFSSGWDAANKVTFRVADGTATAPTYYPFYNEAGIEYSIASGVVGSATGVSIGLSADLALALASHRYVKVQAGPATASATPSTGVTITALLLPL